MTNRDVVKTRKILFSSSQLQNSSILRRFECNLNVKVHIKVITIFNIVSFKIIVYSQSLLLRAQYGRKEITCIIGNLYFLIVIRLFAETFVGSKSSFNLWLSLKKIVMNKTVLFLYTKLDFNVDIKGNMQR